MSDDLVNLSAAEFISGLAAKTLDLKPLKVEGCALPIVPIPAEVGVVDLEGILEYPAHIKEDLAFVSKESFLEYLDRFRTDSTVIFACADTATLLAKVDYHGQSSKGEAGQPRFGHHKASLMLERSVEWSAWSNRAEHGMSQVEFADFVEERAIDFVDPDAATMLEVATNFHVNQKVIFKSAMRLESGDVQLQYDTDTSSKSVEIPDRFTIRIPVFKHGEPVDISARLRYRINEGELRLRYKLDRPDTLYDEAWSNVVAEVRKQSGLPIYL